MSTFLAIVWILLGLPLTALGSLLVITWLKPKKKFTNRISHMRLIWLAMAYPSEFDDLYRKDESASQLGYEEAFPWLVRDVHENF